MYIGNKRHNYRDLSLNEVRQERHRLNERRVDMKGRFEGTVNAQLELLDVRERQILLMRM